MNIQFGQIEIQKDVLVTGNTNTDNTFLNITNNVQFGFQLTIFDFYDQVYGQICRNNIPYKSSVHKVFMKYTRDNLHGSFILYIFEPVFHAMDTAVMLWNLFQAHVQKVQGRQENNNGKYKIKNNGINNNSE